MCQTDRRPLTSLATFSTCLHSGKLSSFDSSLPSFHDVTDCMSASAVTEPYPLVPCVTSTGDVFSPSPGTGLMQPFFSQAQQCANVLNHPTRRPQNVDNVRSMVPVGSWLSTADRAVDYHTVCDTEYHHAVGNSLSAYTSSVLPETTAAVYHRPSYQSTDWTTGYQPAAASQSACSPADVEDTKDPVCCSYLSAAISSDQLADSDESSDAWSPGVTAKKIKQVRQPRIEHGRRTNHAASRRASTGSLLCAAVQLDPVSCSLSCFDPCRLRGCKNRARSVSWPEIVKAVPNQGVVLCVN